MMPCVDARQRSKGQGTHAKTQRRLQRWDDVPLFLALYRRRTLAHAAADLDLDASTLSRRLVAMERSLRCKLFERSRDGLEPTEHAELLVPSAEEAEAAMARLDATISGVEREAEGVVRLSVPPGIAEAFVVPALAKLRREHPLITVELDVSTAVADLTRREADLALRTIRPSAASLVQKRLASSRWIPCAQRSLVDEWGRLTALDRVPWIAWDTSLASIPPAQWLRRALGDRGRIALVTSHFASQLAALDAGVGAALVPEPYLALHATRWRPLKTAPLLEVTMRTLPVDDLWLVGHPAQRSVARVACVWAALEAAFARSRASA